MSSVPILFLDIDDVLCVNQPYSGFDLIDVFKGQHADPDAVFQKIFRAHARVVLKHIHDELDEKPRYVISSTWRQHFTREQMDVIFRKTGLDFVADRLHPIWATAAISHRCMRSEDIEQWLDEHHEGEPFAILDDTFSGPSLLPALKSNGHRFSGRVVLCKECVGLMPEHVKSLLQALRRTPVIDGQKGAQ